MLITANQFDCNYHRDIRNRLESLPPSAKVDFLRHKYDGYKGLRVAADYSFDDDSIIKLLDPQTFKDSHSSDWQKLKEL